MFKKLGFAFVLLLTCFLWLGSGGSVSAAGCGTVYIDNDDPNHRNIHTGGWSHKYDSTAVNSYRGDHRILSTGINGGYGWSSYVTCTDDYYVDVYLYNIKFNNPRAVYYAGNRDWGVNQNNAPAGWGRIGFATGAKYYPTFVQVKTNPTSSTLSTFTGADGIRLVQPSFTQSFAANSLSFLSETDSGLKDQIHSKMLNSIDNFENVKGSFNYWSKPAGFNYSVDYMVKTGNNPSSIVKIIENGEDVIESSYDGKSNVILFNDKKEYSKKNIKPNNEFRDKEKKQLGVSPKNRYLLGNNKEKIYLYKSDYTNMNAAKDSLFPQEIALGYLEDYSQWEIVDDSTKYAGVEAVLIEGTFNEYYAAKHQASTFKLWVHKDTGVLLNLEEYDSDMELVSGLATQDIKFNDKLNNANFHLETPPGFKKRAK
ncbi:hypothetical protein [Bacillus sp. REN16]|uniref:hypothetical protein n=1 Tax=Bacillus sp. REN16 TaxID=2887296 RepID=UPI001E4B2852|nr:hypothetical protein [Bacillus sp. REN16]MCC3359683.1 hypothetical protein [Bacillus sp. REN16]